MNAHRRWLLMLLLLTAGGCGHRGEQGKAKEAADADDRPPQVAVRVEPAEQRTIGESVAGLGRCEALPQHLALLTAAVEGRVVGLLAQPGDAVKAGQIIVQFDPAVAQANLEEKKAAVEAQLAALRLLESLPRPEEQNAAKLAIEQARLTVDKSRSTVEHLRPLRQRNEVPETAMYEAEVTHEQAELQLKTARAQYETLMLRPRPQAIEEAKSRIAATTAATATAAAQLKQLAIRSPIDGVLDSLSCQLGQTLSVGSLVGQVLDSKQLHVILWLSVPEAQRVRRGQAARIRQGDSPSEATIGGDRKKGTVPFSSDENRPQSPAAETSGTVIFVGSAADPQTGSLPVRVLVDNAQRQLTLGQVVSVSITVGRKEVLAVPVAAVHDLGEGPLVSVLREGKIVVLHPAIGLADRRWVEVSGSDLRAGEPVVVEGGYNLPEGTKVAVAAGPAGEPGSSPGGETAAEKRP
jgi:RND family efflux transporter MFP subunit